MVRLPVLKPDAPERVVAAAYPPRNVAPTAADLIARALRLTLRQKELKNHLHVRRGSHWLKRANVKQFRPKQQHAEMLVAHWWPTRHSHIVRVQPRRIDATPSLTLRPFRALDLPG